MAAVQRRASRKRHAGLLLTGRALGAKMPPKLTAAGVSLLPCSIPEHRVRVELPVPLVGAEEVPGFLEEGAVPARTGSGAGLVPDGGVLRLSVALLATYQDYQPVECPFAALRLRTDAANR